MRFAFDVCRLVAFCTYVLSLCVCDRLRYAKVTNRSRVDSTYHVRICGTKAEYHVLCQATRVTNVLVIPSHLVHSADWGVDEKCIYIAEEYTMTENLMGCMDPLWSGKDYSTTGFLRH